MQTIYQNHLRTRRIELYPRPSEPIPKQIAISVDGAVRVINIDDIIYLKANGNYTAIHLSDGERIMTSITLKRYADKLSNNPFIRVHNNCIVQRSRIKCFVQKDAILVLDTNDRISVARSRKDELITYFKSLSV